MIPRTAHFFVILIGFLSASWTVSAQTGDAVGLSDIRIEDQAGRRNLDVSVWYPTSSMAEAALFADSPIFKGFRAVRDGEARQGRFPLVIISHGLGGNRNNLNWLGVKLAAESMIVAALNHPGTTRGDMLSPETRRPWERPRDISRVITFLLADPRFGERINRERIAAIGHSLGGNSVMALAGAQFDVERFARDCDEYPRDRDCRWFLDNAIDRDPAAVAQTQQSLRDERAAAVVALDAGLARAFTPESLTAVTTPVLLIESVRRVAGRPVGMYSRHLAASLPPDRTSYREISDARHFSYMAECKLGAADLLKAEGRGDEIACLDGDGRDRSVLHAEIFGLVRQFLRGVGF